MILHIAWQLLAISAETRVIRILLQVRICCRAFKILVEEVGFDPQDVIFDPNILTIGTGMAEHNNYAVDFFEACGEIKRLCPGCKISGGVSNIAFSFRGNEPVRRAFHSAFLHYACRQGMDMGIVNAAQVRRCMARMAKRPLRPKATFISVFQSRKALLYCSWREP